MPPPGMGAHTLYMLALLQWYDSMWSDPAARLRLRAWLVRELTRRLMREYAIGSMAREGGEDHKAADARRGELERKLFEVLDQGFPARSFPPPANSAADKAKVAETCLETLNGFIECTVRNLRSIMSLSGAIPPGWDTGPAPGGWWRPPGQGPPPPVEVGPDPGYKDPGKLPDGLRLRNFVGGDLMGGGTPLTQILHERATYGSSGPLTAQSPLGEGVTASDVRMAKIQVLIRRMNQDSSALEP